MEFKVNDWVEVVKTTALNGRKITVFKLTRVDCINDEYFINIRYSGVLKLSLSEIEPFTGTLPSRIKS